MSVFFLIMSLEQGITLKHRTIGIHLLLLPTLNRELYSYLFASCSSDIPTLPIFWELLSFSVLLSGKLFPWVFSSFRYVLIYHLKNSSFKTLYEILTLFNSHFVLLNSFLFLIRFIITTSLCTLAKSDLTLWEHMDCSSPGSSAHEFPRQEYRSELPLPSPEHPSDLGIELTSPALVDRFFTTEPPEKP